MFKRCMVQRENVPYAVLFAVLAFIGCVMTPVLIYGVLVEPGIPAVIRVALVVTVGVLCVVGVGLPIWSLREMWNGR